eukprot:3128793-Pleurochrysis_carterae.AAC.1
MRRIYRLVEHVRVRVGSVRRASSARATLCASSRRPHARAPAPPGSGAERPHRLRTTALQVTGPRPRLHTRANVRSSLLRSNALQYANPCMSKGAYPRGASTSA